MTTVLFMADRSRYRLAVRAVCDCFFFNTLGSRLIGFLLLRSTSASAFMISVCHRAPCEHAKEMRSLLLVLENNRNKPLQLCTASTVFSILITVRLYTVMPEVCRWLTNEKQRQTDIRLTDQ